MPSAFPSPKFLRYRLRSLESRTPQKRTEATDEQIAREFATADDSAEYTRRYPVSEATDEEVAQRLEN